jgi:hypothetical protein
MCCFIVDIKPETGVTIRFSPCPVKANRWEKTYPLVSTLSYANGPFAIPEATRHPPASPISASYVLKEYKILQPGNEDAIQSPLPLAEKEGVACERVGGATLKTTNTHA